MDPLYKASNLRRAAAEIIRHCRTWGFDHDTGIGRAWLRDEPYYEDAGAMLASRGFGSLSRSICSGRGNVFTIRA